MVGGGGGDLTGSMLGQRDDVSMVHSQCKYAKDIKPATTRRNAKPDNCATPFEIRNYVSTTQQGNGASGAGAARSELPPQHRPAVHAHANSWTRSKGQPVGVCHARQFADFAVDVVEHPSERLPFCGTHRH